MILVLESLVGFVYAHLDVSSEAVNFDNLHCIYRMQSIYFVSLRNVCCDLKDFHSREESLRSGDDRDACLNVD